MSDTVIRIENLGKRYKLGQTHHDRLSDVITSGVTKLTDGFRRFFARNGSQTAAEPMFAAVNPSKTPSSPEEKYIWALRNVSFEIDRGEVVGIIGRNGAGKSTLLKILTGITEPTEGRIWMKGRVASLLEVGTGFHPELTGRENVFLNGAILGMSKAEIRKKFDEIVAFAEVEKFVDTPVKRYSSGMYVRLAFAVAAHLEPEILLVDEVLAVGDASFQKKCLGKMGEVTKEGRTVLFVSHNMAAIKKICESCILIVDGSIRVHDGADKVVTDYLKFCSLGQTGKGEIEWANLDKAPSCEVMRFRSIRVVDSEMRTQDTVPVDKPMKIQIGYEVLQVLRGMRLVVQLTTYDGIIVLATTNHDREQAVLEPGKYTSSVTIPGGLLNTSQYAIRVHAGIPGIKVLIPPQEYLNINCVGSTDHGSGFTEKWPGLVAPHLEWEIERIDQGLSAETD